jgi:cell division transport system permease protein
MGATERFIRTPFLLEGGMQGVAGAGLAIGMLYGLFLLVGSRAASIFGTSFSVSKLGFLPAAHLGYGLAIGACCGLVGALFATRSEARG